MQKYYLFILLILVLPICTASYCYQEFFNQSTLCGAESGGSYNIKCYTPEDCPESEFNNINSWKDGNWNTETHPESSYEHRINITYNMSKFAKSAKWQVKDFQGYPAVSSVNITIPSTCFASSFINKNLKLYLKWYVDGSMRYNVSWGCYNVNTPLNLRSSVSLDGWNAYEEAIYWNITGNINITLRDFYTKNLITANMTLNYISNSIQYQKTTTSGKISITNIPMTYNENITLRSYSTKVTDYYISEIITTINNNNVTMYLLNISGTTDTPITFIALEESFGTPIQGAVLKIYKQDPATNTYLEITDLTTNSDGTAYTTLSTNNVFYRYDLYYGGVLVYSLPEPVLITTSTSTIYILADTISVSNINYAEGIDISFRPLYTDIENNTAHNFSINITSSVFSITDCYLKLYSATNVLLYSIQGTFSSGACYKKYEYNVAANTGIKLVAYYELNHATNITVSNYYNIFALYEGRYSLNKIFGDITSLSGEGWNGFNRALIGFILTLISVGTIALTMEVIRDPAIIVGLVILMTFVFSYYGWYTINNANFNPTIQKYGTFLLVFLFGGVFILDAVVNK